MPERARRIDLRFGDIAISAEGFDDPVAPVKQVLRFVQRLVEETPEMAGAALALDDADIERLVGEIAERMRIPRDGIEAVPGLILSLRPDAAPRERADGLADAAGVDGAATLAAAGTAAAAALAASGMAAPSVLDGAQDGTEDAAEDTTAAEEEADVLRSGGEDAAAADGPDDDAVGLALPADDAEASQLQADAATDADSPWTAGTVEVAETETEALPDAPAADLAETDIDTAGRDDRSVGSRPFAFLRGGPAADRTVGDATPAGTTDATAEPDDPGAATPGDDADAQPGAAWAAASGTVPEATAEDAGLPLQDPKPEPADTDTDTAFVPAAAPWQGETEAAPVAGPEAADGDGGDDRIDAFGATEPDADIAPEPDAPAPSPSDWRPAPFAAGESAGASFGFGSHGSDDAPPETIFGAPDGADGPALAPTAPDSTATLFGDSDLSPGAPVNIFGDPGASDAPAGLAPGDGPEDADDTDDRAMEPEDATVIGPPVRAAALPPEDAEEAPDPAGEADEVNIFGGAARATVLPPEDAEEASDPAGEADAVNIFGGPSRATVLPPEDAEEAPDPAGEADAVNIFGGPSRATVLPPEDAEEAPDPAGEAEEVNIFGGPARATVLPPEDAEEVNIFGGPAPGPSEEPPQERDELRRRLFGGPATPAPGPRWIEDPNEPAPLPRAASDRLGSVMSRYRAENGRADEPADAADDPSVTAVWHPAEGPAIEPGALAERANAVTVPDLLTVAAAWLTLVDRRSTFGRREVMEVFDQMPGDHPRTLEARIKGYGKLVRNGSLVLVDDGRFALSQEERDRFRPLIG